jgi:hypothetical protein
LGGWKIIAVNLERRHLAPVNSGQGECLMVAEKIYRLPLADISRIRITCHNCKISSEAASPSKLSGVMPYGQCPHCKATLYETQAMRNDPMAKLGEAMDRLVELQGLTIEFVIPDPENQPKKILPATH